MRELVKKRALNPKRESMEKIQIDHFMGLPTTPYGFTCQLGIVTFSVWLSILERGSGSDNLIHVSGSRPSC